MKNFTILKIENSQIGSIVDNAFQLDDVKNLWRFSLRENKVEKHSTGVHHAAVALEAFGVAVAVVVTVMIAEGAVVVAAAVTDGMVAVAVVVGLAVNVAVLMSVAAAVVVVSALIQLLR